MSTFDEVIKKLKIKLNLEKDKELYDLMGIKQSTFTNWRTRNKIPYEEIINYCNENNITFSDIFGINNTSQNKFKNNNINGNNINSVQVNQNNGQIHISGNNDLEHKICESVKKLSDKRKMYYYHKIEAELLEDE